MTTSAGEELTMTSFMDTLISSASEIPRYLAKEYTKDEYGKKGYSKSTDIDYTVFKVGILTLGLLLMVELLRHKVDVSAKNRPFFLEVLHVFYSELAILGIVEFGVFLILEYHKNINKDQKYLFARVHFMLFYTAVINITQSVIIAIFTHKVSRRMWVDTEQLELNHYVALREEFDEVEAKVNFSGFNSSKNKHVVSETESDQKDHLAEETFSLRKWWKYAKKKIESPALMRKYEKLLVQVRFHELRVHFCKANDLPLKFKVSEYLQKSELNVLIHLVHVGSFAWLTLMGAVNLIYFLMSVVAWVNSQQIEKTLKGMFIGFCCLFVVTSVVLIEKMKWIFAYIMHTRLIDTNAMKDDTEGNDKEQRNSSKLSSTRQQLDLFWFSNPSLVTGSIQLMQFGYSIFASVLIMFWKDLDKSGYTITGVILSGVCFGSWLLFIFVIVQVIPRYTLCTSLGQLVNVKTMRECLAKYSLEEAVKRRKKQLERAEKEEQMKSVTGSSFAKSQKLDSARGSSVLTNTVQTSVRDSRSNMSQRSTGRGLGLDSDSESDTGSTNLSKLADLVTKPTKDLPKLSPGELARVRSQRKSRRRKALSDGVAAMRATSERVLSGLDGSMHKKSMHGSNNNSNRDIDALLQASGTGRVDEVQASGTGRGDEVKKDLTRETEQKTLRENGSPRRTTRLKKSVSANVALMRSPTSSLFATESDGNAVKNRALGLNDGTMMNIPGESISGSVGVVLDAVLEDIPARNYTSSTKAQRSIDADDKRKGRQKNKKRSEGKTREIVSKGRGTGSTFVDVISSEDDGDESIEMVASTGSGKSLTSPVVCAQKKSDEALLFEELAAASKGSGEASSQKKRGGALSFEELVTASKASGEASSTQSSEEYVHVTDDGNRKTSSSKVAIDITEASDNFPTKIEDMVVKTNRSILSMDYVRDFLRTSYYRKLSGVCGSMVCFFFVGVRMETLLVSSGVIAKNPSTMQIPGHIPFWMELVWLSMFIIVSAFTAVAFFPRATMRGKMAMTVAGMSDILLSSTCLVLLVVSETKRTTGTFGSKERLKDGVGMIEPFTSLIALRVLRFLWGKYLVKWWDGRKKPNGYPNEVTVTMGEVGLRRASSITRPEKEKTVDHHSFDMTQNKGTMLELWRTALSHYPHIVQEHGEFSSELLQAMLGVPIVETGAKKKDL